MQLRRRHEIILVGGHDPFDELTFVRLPGHDCYCARFGRLQGIIPHINPQAALAFLFIESMTVETGIREYRTDIAVELNFRLGLCGDESSTTCGGYEAEMMTEHGKSLSDWSDAKYAPIYMVLTPNSALEWKLCVPEPQSYHKEAGPGQ